MNHYLEKKTFFKDIITYYAYTLIVYGVALLFLWAHMYFSLNLLKISMDEVMSSNPLPASNGMPFSFDYYEILWTYIRWFIPALVSFGVFFTKTPKLCKQFIAALCIIMTVNIGISFLIQTSLAEIIRMNLYTCFVIILAWVCSLLRHKLSNKLNKS